MTTPQIDPAVIGRAIERFRKETFHLSDTGSRLAKGFGRELITYSDDTVKYIFSADVPLDAHIMSLLTQITKQNPIPEEDAGKIERMGEYWRAWAKRNGYL